MIERTWTITDPDGSNARTVTLAQYRAELEASRRLVAPVVDAIRSGDLKACGDAQQAIRNRSN